MCLAQGCGQAIPRGYFMCTTHWRLVPPEVKRVWRESVSDYLADRSRDAGEALIENRREIVQIVAAIEAGTAP